MEYLFARIRFHVPHEVQVAWLHESRKAGVSLADWVIGKTECTSTQLEYADNNARLAMAAGSLLLSLGSIAVLTTIGGIRTSRGRAVSWLSELRQSKDLHAKVVPNRPMSDAEFAAFLAGLRSFLDRLERKIESSELCSDIDH